MVTAARPKPAAARIRSFLKASDGPLTVAVCYASAYGLWWLNENTADRPVTLFVGDMGRCLRPDKRLTVQHGATVFVKRADTTVLRARRHGGGVRLCHLKAWAAGPEHRRRALLGSANLTRRGLCDNIEAVAEPAGGDLRLVLGQVDAAVACAVPGGRRALRLLTPQPKPPPVPRSLRRPVGGSARPADVGVQRRLGPRQRPAHTSLAGFS